MTGIPNEGSSVREARTGQKPVPDAPGVERPGQPEPLVQAVNVCKVYPGQQALRNVSFSIPRGVIVGLLGPNGSGKSTLLRILAGLARPSSGHVRVLGQEPGFATKAHVAYLSELDYLYAHMTAAQAIRFHWAGFPDFSPEAAYDLLAQMGLNADQRIGTLSKGQRARLKLVLALARRADLILLDEPLSGIDPTSRERIMQAIAGQYRVGESSIILSTHQVEESEPLFDQVLFLNDGELILQGEAEALRSQHGKSIDQLFREVYHG